MNFIFVFFSFMRVTHSGRPAQGPFPDPSRWPFPEVFQSLVTAEQRHEQDVGLLGASQERPARFSALWSSGIKGDEGGKSGPKKFA